MYGLSRVIWLLRNPSVVPANVSPRTASSPTIYEHECELSTLHVLVQLILQTTLYTGYFSHLHWRDESPAGTHTSSEARG